ncbi:MAG: BatD family protein, partial [Planctomycetes bacterium]|nr:BatD family protein [Planctomycetota bacterium]
MLIPRFTGEQVIRSIPFSSFDLKSKSYKILASEPIDISVAKGDQPLLAAPIGASKEDVRFIGQDIRFIQTRLPEFSRVGPVFYKRVPFYVVLTLPLLAFVAAYGYRKHLDKLSS